MSTKSEYASYPAPRTVIPLMAPSMQSQVQATIDAHPEIDSMDEEARGELIDITDWRVNVGIETPWGRKARQNNPSDPQLNTDGMTYLRPDGLFEIYDCISGIDGQATWDGYGPYAPGENGYWWPPQGSPSAPPDTGTPPVPAEDLTPRVAALEQQVAALSGQVAQLAEAFAQPTRAHGPVDLPIVVENWNRMRAKGDIDVEVKPGTATPPVDSGEEFTIADLAFLRHFLGASRPEDR